MGNDDKEQLQKEIAKMKKILNKKEKRLNKYDRALSARNHVRDTITRHNSGSLVSDNFSNAEEDSGKPKASTHIKSSKSVKFQEATKAYDNENGTNLQKSFFSHTHFSNDDKENLCDETDFEHANKEISDSKPHHIVIKSGVDICSELETNSLNGPDSDLFLGSLEHQVKKNARKNLMEMQYKVQNGEEFIQSTTSFIIRGSGLDSGTTNTSHNSTYQGQLNLKEDPSIVFSQCLDEHASIGSMVISTPAQVCRTTCSQVLSPPLSSSQIRSHPLTNSKVNTNSLTTTMVDTSLLPSTKLNFIPGEGSQLCSDTMLSHLKDTALLTSQQFFTEGNIVPPADLPISTSPSTATQVFLEDSSNENKLKCIVEEMENVNISKACLASEKLSGIIKNDCERLCSDLKPKEIPSVKENSENSKHPTIVSPLKTTNENIKVESLEEEPKNIISSAISHPSKGMPCIFILYRDGCSVWQLMKSDGQPKNNRNLFWKKKSEKKIDLLCNQDTHLVAFGGRSEFENTLLMVKSPEKCGPFTLSLLQYTEDEELKTASNQLLQGCCDCTISGCESKTWSFFLYIDACRNHLCSNANSPGCLYHISYDLVYSVKRRNWDLLFEVEKKEQVSVESLVSINYLWNYEAAMKSKSEGDVIFWQDCSGRLGFSDATSSFPIKSSNSDFNIEEIIASGVLVYGAVVKEILLLVLKTEKVLSFVAVNPLSSQFDIFYSVELSEEMFNGKITSSFFYENKFFFLTSEGKIITLFS